MRTRLLPIAAACAALACAVLVAAACGGDDSSEPPPPGAREVVMTDYAFDPKDLTVDRGVTVSVVNEGGIAHNLTIEKGPNPRKETDELTGTSSFLAGKRENLEIDLPSGRYAMVCTVPGHRELGMTGTLRVR
jgi:plastocyanin